MKLYVVRNGEVEPIDFIEAVRQYGSQIDEVEDNGKFLEFRGYKVFKTRRRAEESLEDE